MNIRMTRTRLVVSVVASLLLGLLAFAVVGYGSGATPGSGHEQQGSREGGQSGGFLATLGVGNPSTPEYPSEWRVPDLASAESEIGYSLLVPAHALANEQNMNDVYVLPGKAATLIFPPPAKPVEYIRQEYLEVYQAPWSLNLDPLTWYQRDLEAAPSPAKSIIDVGGVPALVVEAHSPKDDFDQSNPAFMRFVLNGIEIQVSGGESLKDLMAVAETIIAQK